MNELDSLAKVFDEIDVGYANTAKNSSDPLWAKRVAEKDHVVDQIGTMIQTVPASFQLVSYLISPSHGRQAIALQRIRFIKDPMHLDLICYMLLNSSSNFFQFHILKTLDAVSSQCDYRQLTHIQQALRCYLPPKETARSSLKDQLLESIEAVLVFSITEIVKNTHWWQNVESKFFNSLSGIRQYRPRSLYAIRNSRLFERFEDYRSTLDQNAQLIMFVYHGSSPECLRAIAENGFLEPKVLSEMSNDDLESQKIKVINLGNFGRGIYQGFAADYAIYYAEHYKKSDEIMLSAVLPGRSYTVKKGGEKYGGCCEPGFHSHISPEEKEIVLFQSAQVLPMFIIRFERVSSAQVTEEQR
jgi:hypothetical protein